MILSGRIEGTSRIYNIYIVKDMKMKIVYPIPIIIFLVVFFSGFLIIVEATASQSQYLSAQS